MATTKNEEPTLPKLQAGARATSPKQSSAAINDQNSQSSPLAQNGVPSTSNKERLLVTILGKDRIGIVAELMTCVSKCGVELIDLQQTAVRGHLSLALQLLLRSDAVDSQLIFRELVLAAKRLDLKVEFDLIPEHEKVGVKGDNKGKVENDKTMRRWGVGGGRQYVLTILSAESISTRFLEELCVMLANKQCQVQKVTKLSEGSLRCLELVISKFNTEDDTEDVTDFTRYLYEFSKKHGIDIAVQEESFLRRSKRLVVMDMDSTLIQQEIIDELARHAGKYDAVKEITHRAMSGGMDFKESLRQRVALLKGTPFTAFDAIRANLKYTKGAHHLCKSLRKLGYRLAVISGGFTAITEHVRRELQLDYDYANQLEVGDDGCFTGRTIGPIVSAQRKADLLVTIAQQEKITLDQVIAIGDGANDLPMLSTAGLGIAFQAKDAVQKAARFRINQPNLGAVLYLLGFSDADQQELSGRGRNNWAAMKGAPLV